MIDVSGRRDRVCETCVYFKAYNGVSGECRHDPPKPFWSDGRRLTLFPEVVSGSWCGCHARNWEY